MYHIEWYEKDGKHSVNVEPVDKADQMAYILEGYSHGWILDYNIEYRDEQW